MAKGSSSPIRCRYALLPDVIKNTNLKVAHQLVAADDQDVLGHTMSLSESQARSLTVLGLGEAAVFSDGDDGALRIHVPGVRGNLERVSAAGVAQTMARWRADPASTSLFA